jgi:hypothetical protein
MAFLGKLDENTLKDHWVKKLLKTYDPGPLSDLIEERIKWQTTGPSRPYNSGELPTDIIDALIGACPPDFRKKMEPAVGLLLYKILHNKINENDNIIAGVFSMIRANKFTECTPLLRKWLNNKSRYLTTSAKSDNDIYYAGMMALADAQQPDKELEEYWLNLWKESKSFFWAASFYGLRKQNPEVAVNEYELLVKRNPEKTSINLIGVWRDIRSRSLLERAISKGLHKENKYAARALNLMLSSLDDDDRTELMLNLKNQPVKSNNEQTVQTNA